MRIFPCNLRGMYMLLVALLSLMARVQAASFVVEKSSVKFTSTSPGSTYSGSFPSAIGDFGIPQYGGMLVGKIGFSQTNPLGCNQYTARPGNADIVLVDRGVCYFVEKAYYAQLAGASAVIVADHTQEELLTMAMPEDLPDLMKLASKITIPVVLVQKNVGDTVKSLLEKGDVQCSLDWKDSIAHPDDRVEYEYWFTTNDQCGEICTAMNNFTKNFNATAIGLESQKFTQFTPHVMLKSCIFGDAATCNNNCIRNQRYCAVEPVPTEYAGKYNGAAVVDLNLGHLCAFQTANATGQPWRWWDFAARFAATCTMSTGRFDRSCVSEQLTAAGIDANAVLGCMGRSSDNAPHDVLEAQLSAQEDTEGSGRGRVIMLPTIVINNDQYRGRLDPAALLRALCSAFREGTEPPVCLSGGLGTNDCGSANEHCWKSDDGKLSACQDTFRGFMCRCPAGYEGDGYTCNDIDECSLGISGCDQVCINTPGSYCCECNSGYTLHGGQGAPGICIPSAWPGVTRIPGWLVAVLLVASAVSISAVGVAVYRWKLRQEMHGEIRAIMREYMPLDSFDVDQRPLMGAGNNVNGGGGGGKSRGGRVVRFQDTSSDLEMSVPGPVGR